MNKLTIAEIQGLPPYSGFLSSRNSRLTSESYAHRLGVFHQWISSQGIKAQGAKPGDLAQFISGLGRTYSKATVLHFMHTLGSFYGFMVATEQVKNDPTRVFKAFRFRKPENNPRPIDHVTEKRLVNALRYERFNDVRASCVVLLGLYVGMRREEIRVLKWEDIDREKDIITIRHGKGDKQRTVPMLPIVKTALYCLYCRCRYHFGLFQSVYVFRAPKSRIDKPTAISRIQGMFGEAKWWAGVGNPTMTLHSLRHTFGTRLAEAGESAYIIRDLMGHASIATSEAYVKTTQKQAHLGFRRAHGMVG